MKKKLISLTTTIVLLTLVIWAAVYLLSPDPTSVNKNPHATPVVPAVPTYVPEQDPTLYAMLQQVALDQDKAKGISVVYVDSFANPVEFGESVVVAGKDGKVHPQLKILRGKSEMETKITVAHEYLHVITSAMSDTEFNPIGADVRNLYNSDSYMRNNRMINYRNDQIAIEGFSIYCTESSDAYLSDTLLAQCNKFINRHALSLVR